MEHTELPECSHAVCEGMADPKTRHKLKLAIIKMKSHNVMIASRNLTFPSPSRYKSPVLHPTQDFGLAFLDYYLPDDI